MSDTVMQSGQTKDTTVLVHLSEEFQQVVERIQKAASDLPFGSIGPDRLAQVDAAERSVDARALDLRQGLGDQTAWQAALSEYETASLDLIKSLGERRN